jgi:NAD+ diphosphatase
MRKLPLTAVAYDRAAHHRGDADWLAEAWDKALVVQVSDSGTTPVEQADGASRIAFTPSADVPADGPRRFLGVVDDQPYFSVTTTPQDEWQHLRDVGLTADDLRAGLLTSAVALQLWHGRHQHCSTCGAPTEEVEAGWIRKCTAEGSQHFPRTDPAVIMIVHDGKDHCLLGRGSVWQPGWFSTLAGFVEPGESLEAAVAREVAEEVSVEVAEVSYVASQPWPFPASLMLGFTARVEQMTDLRPDGVEMVEAGWFTRDEVRAAAAHADGAPPPGEGITLQWVPPTLSISRYLIDGWLSGELV